MFMIMADGITWQDADGRTQWPRMEADALASVLWGMGYDAEVKGCVLCRKIGHALNEPCRP